MRSACSPTRRRWTSAKGYNGLFGLVQTGLRRDPLSGELYLFVNLSRKLCKVLPWDGTGLCILQKRLEKGGVRARVAG